MLLIIRRTIGCFPLIQCLTNFTFEAHLMALKKLIILWGLTSLPILVAVGLSPIPSDETDVWLKLLKQLDKAIGAPDLFIYTAAFLTPVLVLYYERREELPQGKKWNSSIRRPFKGYGVVALFSLVTLIITAIAYGATKTDAVIFEKTFLNYYLKDFTMPIYVFSLYCWYLTMLDGASSADFVGINRKSEDSVESGFAERIKAKGARDE